MSQTRRTFLTRLASGLVGLSLVDVEWIPTPILRQVREVPAPTDIEGLTAWVLRLLADEMRGYRGQFVPGDYRLGGAAGFTHHWAIGTSLTDEEAKNGVSVERHLSLVAAQLAHKCAHVRPTHFGGLPFPRGDVEGALATDQVTGITVRGIWQYDLQGSGYEDERGDWVTVCLPGWLCRFDILAKSA